MLVVDNCSKSIFFLDNDKRYGMCTLMPSVSREYLLSGICYSTL